MLKIRSTFRLIPVALLIALLAVTALALPQPTQVQAQGTGMLRFLHAIAGGPNVDVLVNGELAAFNLGALTATRFLTVPSGDLEVSVLASDGKAELAKQTFTVQAGQAQTIAVMGNQAVVLTAYEDELGPIGAGKARITATHTIEGADAVDILQTANGQVILPLITSLAYGAPYGSADLDAVSADVSVVPAGADLDKAIASATVPLVAGTHNRIVVVNGDAPTTIVLTTAIAPEDSNSGLVRLVHGNAEAPAVDVYIDDVLIAPNLEFGAYTPHVAVPGAAVTLALRPAGSDRTGEPLLTQQLDFSTLKAQTVVIGGTLAAPTVLASSDNTSPLGATTARIHVINATGNSVATLDIGPTTIASDDPAAAAGVEIPAVNTFINVDVADNPAFAASGPASFDGGVLYDVIIAGNSEKPQIIFAATGLNETLGSAPTNAIGPTVEDGSEPTAVAELPTATPTTETVAAAPTEAPTTAAAEPTIDQQSQINTAVAATFAAMATTPAPVAEIPVTATPVPEVVQVATATPGTETTVGQPGGALAGVVGEVNTDPGVNLKLREYPREDAKTLALMPSGSVVTILGVRGPAESATTAEGTPTVGPTPTLDPTGVAQDQIWVFVSWAQADGGEITGWTKTFFLNVSENGQPIISVEDLLSLPIVPETTFGEINTNLSTPIALDVYNITGTVVVDPGARLQVRRNPSAQSESLTLLEAGTQVIVLQRTPKVGEGTPTPVPDTPESVIWLFISYTSPNGSVQGWVISTFITMMFRGRPLEIIDVPEADPNALPIGSLTGDLAAPAQPTARPGLIATVDKINPDSNLQLRRDPSAQAESLGLVPSGTQLSVLGRNGDGNWLLVDFNGTQGWISSFYVTVTKDGRLFNIAEITNVTADEDIAASITPGPSPTPTLQPTAG
ncbi:MAG: DUF4397 domain-containing protein [Anaerolineae bacterium]|nr:DUF4397 domain-containing protein [Anaerolineae bacterium]